MSTCLTCDGITVDELRNHLDDRLDYLAQVADQTFERVQILDAMLQAEHQRIDVTRRLALTALAMSVIAGTLAIMKS